MEDPMTLLPLVDPKNMEPDIRQTMETYQNWVGDTVYAQFMANVPDIFRKFNEFYMTVLGGRVESETKELARLRLSRLNGCLYCQSANVVWARNNNIPERKLTEIDHWWDSDAFSVREKAIFTLADRFAFSAPSERLDDRTLAMLREHFSDAEILELACFFAFVIGYQRMNAVFDVQYGCPLPAPSGEKELAAK
jgi:alkylhydroperoxidase family enzyme